MSFPAAAQGGPMVAARARSPPRGLGRRQQPAGQPQGQGQGQGQPQGQSPPAASGTGGPAQPSGGQGQSPAAAASGPGASPAAPAGPAASSAPGGAQVAPAASSPAGAPAASAPAAGQPSAAAPPADPNAPQGGKPGGPTNLPPAASSPGGSQQPTAVVPTSFSAPSWSTDKGAFISSTAQNGGAKGLSQPVIGALVGGIIGGIALIIVSFVIWRQCRGRGEKIAPPPPREVSYCPPTLVGSRSRSMSMTISNHRVSSYSTLIAPPTSASGHFRQSYYSAYPVDSPTSSIQQDQSPRFPSNPISGSPSLTSSGGNTTPHREASTGSGSTSNNNDAPTTAFQEHDGRPLHRGLTSADQLSPYDGVTSSDGSESRTTGSDSRTSSPPPSIAPSIPGRIPRRNPSSGSLGGGLRYGSHRQMSGAPHTRQVSITLPRPLSTTSVNALDTNPVSPRVGSYHGSNRNTPRGSMYAVGEFGAQSAQAASPSGPSGHRRGPSTSSRTSGHRPDAAEVDNLRFEGREDIV